MKDYLKMYGGKTPRKFENGGGMAAPNQQQPAPQPGMQQQPAAAPAMPGAQPGMAPQGGQPDPNADPNAQGGQLEAMAQEYVTSRSPELAVQIADMVVAQLGLEQQPATQMPGAAPMPGATPQPGGAGAPVPMGQNGMAIPKIRSFGAPTEMLKPQTVKY